MEEGPERDALTAALAKECYVPVYLDPKTVSQLAFTTASTSCVCSASCCVDILQGLPLRKAFSDQACPADAAEHLW